MKLIEIRHVERFPEPDFSRLQRDVFSEIERPSPQLALAIDQESPTNAPIKHVHAPIRRLGAYVEEELVGWSFGWRERGNVFYMANSGVMQSYRRQGIYTSLVAATREHALSQGAIAIRSQHSVLNNAVLIAKLQLGFHVSGLTLSAQLGAMVELIHHFHAERHDLFRSRALPYVVPEA